MDITRDPSPGRGDAGGSGEQLRERRLPFVLAIALGIMGLGLLWGGAQLALLGGSLFYLAAGILLLLVAVLTWRASHWALWAYAALMAYDVVWTLLEVGLNVWAMLPRLALFFAFGIWLAMASLRRGAMRAKAPLLGLAVPLVLVPILAVAAIAFDRQAQVPSTYPVDPTRIVAGAGDDWPNYGGSPSGTRFSRLDEITPDNVASLRVAWSYDFQDDPPYGLEVTPIKIGNTLYACNSSNVIVALDAETGRELWKFDPRADLSNAPFRACRGVGYYAVPGATGICASRIFTNTVDARLIALDAQTGRRCPSFGRDGQVSLFEGMGIVRRGYYFHNGAPTIARGRIIVGGTVTDNQRWGEPSGVIRAYDAVTGNLAWAYDVGQPSRLGAPPAGRSYTPSTPNAWGQMAYDDQLGLIYVPTGNSTPDYFGAQRRPFDDEISSSVMALDVETGRRRWVFQTVHHDLWDYDVGSQPVLVDLPSGAGVVRALVQSTKRGEIFLLNRETGRPLSAVEERRTPQNGAAPGERPSPTQPFPVGMPSLAGEPLTESAMWGITPFDQMWCRIRFREARYDGPMTPPGLTPSIMYPGFLGGMNWGSVSVDTDRALLVAVTGHVANYVRLVPRAEANAAGAFPLGSGREGMDALRGINAQAGLPYAVVSAPFLSPLRMPCQQPPWSRLTTVDLRTGRTISSQPLGTGQDSGPLGVPSLLPARIGTPSLGGVLLTSTDLTFVGASTDRTFRAFQTSSGRLLWQAPLPSSGHATPMSYRAPGSGRQFVVIAAGGHRILGTKYGDRIVAFALR